jgi:DNA-binding beta-propeller fold protein YncE
MEFKMKRATARTILTSLLAIFSIMPAFAVAPDTVTNTLTGITQPFTGAISPDGTYVYTIGYGNSTLYKVNASNATLIKTVTLATSAAIRQILFLPDGSAALYIDAGNGTLVKIATSNDSVTATTSVGSNPYNFAISPDGRYAYIALQAYPTVIKRYLTSTLALDSTYNLPIGARFVAISPDGSQAFAIGSTQVAQFNTSSGVASPSITVGTCTNMNAGSYTVSGNFLYVLCNTPNSNIYKINTSTNSLSGSPISISGSGYIMSTSPDGSFMYVASYGASSIFRLRVSDDSITATISAIGGPYGVAISSDATFAYSFNYGASSISRINTGSILAGTVTANLSLPSGGKTITYRSNSTIRFTISTPSSGGDGKVTFFQNGKRIANCINLLSSGGIVDCSYKPSVIGTVAISARIVPTSSSYVTSNTPSLNLSSINRTGRR